MNQWFVSFLQTPEKIWSSNWNSSSQSYLELHEVQIFDLLIFPAKSGFVMNFRSLPIHQLAPTFQSQALRCPALRFLARKPRLPFFFRIRAFMRIEILSKTRLVTVLEFTRRAILDTWPTTDSFASQLKISGFKITGAFPSSWFFKSLLMWCKLWIFGFKPKATMFIFLVSCAKTR